METEVSQEYNISTAGVWGVGYPSDERRKGSCVGRRFGKMRWMDGRTPTLPRGPAQHRAQTRVNTSHQLSPCH